ncbi:hypothetical protein [Nostoc sp.]|nr:hypothetical protein [Nostoc sp. S13]
MPDTSLREATPTASLRDALAFAQYKCPIPNAPYLNLKSKI